MKKIKLPQSYYNYVSILGTIVASIAWVTIIFLFIWAKIFHSGVYFDLFIFLIVPGFLVTGLLMIAFGMWRESKRLKKEKLGIDAENKRLIINLNDHKTRNAIIIFIGVTCIFLISTVIGGYQGFHYTESVEFCGTLCHDVMNPEYVAYQHSPHANVKCAECHVGEGVDWYVKSKISGLRQVYKYMLGTYVRPIETPIANLRPARETCEKCHWPQKFYTNKLHMEKYYLADSANTEWNIYLNMKIGANHSSGSLTQGIHWHINPDVSMEYKSDSKREAIPWVKMINKKTGLVVEFKDANSKATEDSLKKLEMRILDCMDCHNRPSHEYRSPNYFIDNLLASQKVNSLIPWIKDAAMNAVKKFPSTLDSAKKGITDKINKYYSEKHPAALQKFGKDITAAITEIQNAFSINVFPEMKVSFDKYPRHIGHLETNGCFRCHDGNHKSKEGKVISKDCNLCHTFIGQGPKDSTNYTGINKTLEFRHPADIGDAWKETNCMECHLDMNK